MNIVVCMKLVPATTADIRVAADGSALQLAGVETIVSPYDEYALEAALKLREQFPGSKIHAVTVGGEDASKCLLHAFSLGVDAGTHVKEPNADARAAARCVAALVRGQADVVFCGRQAVDDDQWLFPGALAELLDMAHASAVTALATNDGVMFGARRRFEGGEQVLSIQAPAVISCDKGLNEPRAPTLKGRLDAKKKQAAVKTGAELGLSAADLTPALQVVRYAPPAQKSPGKIISGEPASAAAELVRLLRQEAKII